MLTAKRTREEIINKIEEKGYFYIDDYYDEISRKRRVVIEDNFGYKYDVVYGNILNQSGLEIIVGSNPFTLSNMSLWLKINKSQFFLLENNHYENSVSKLNFYCEVCKDYPVMRWAEVSQMKGCGVCKGYQVGRYHSLSNVNPKLSSEWHPSKNGNLKPSDVTCGSSRKVWWLCPNGHEYFSYINDRSRGRGCGVCFDERKESLIASGLKNYFSGRYETKTEYRIFKNPETNYYLPFDIYIFRGENPKINGVYIEIHGEQHYKASGWNKRKSIVKQTSSEEEFEYQKYKDKIKKNFAKKNGIYIEIDLRKNKSLNEWIGYIEGILESGEGN